MRGSHLAPNIDVALGVLGAALRMAHDHGRCPHVFDQFSGNVAGVGPARQGMTILPPHQQAPACDLARQ